MRRLKFRKITLRLENEKILYWNPLDIKKIEFHKDWIKINNEIIEKKDVYYPHWRYFILELIRTFKIEWDE